MSAGSLLPSTTSPKTTLSSKRRTLAVVSQKRYAAAQAASALGQDTFNQGSNAQYIDEMYMAWKEDPNSVHISWQAYFKNVEDGSMPLYQAFQAPPNLVAGVPSVMPGIPASSGQDSDIIKHLNVGLLVRAYQIDRKSVV